MARRKNTDVLGLVEFVDRSDGFLGVCQAQPREHHAVGRRHLLLKLLGRISDFFHLVHEAEALMLVMDIQRPVDRTKKSRFPLVIPLGQGMFEEEWLDDLDLVLAKMDHIAKFEKTCIAEPMDLVMVMAAHGQDFDLRMGTPDNGCVRGVRQLGVAVIQR